MQQERMPTYAVTHPKLSRMAYGIDPSDIKFHSGTASDSLKASFGKCEVDTSAARLVRFFQHKGGWCTFTYAELEAFAEEAKIRDTFKQGLLFGLAEDWLDDGPEVIRMGGMVIVTSDGRLKVTDQFVLWVAGRREEIREILNREAEAIV